MCGVIVIVAGRSWSTNLGCDAYIMIIAWISSCDTDMTSSIVNSIEAKPVKQRGHKNVTKTNAMQAVRFHRGKDGHVRELCGPRINLAISRPETNYMTHALEPGDVIGTLVQRPIRMESKGVQLCLIKEKREENVGDRCRN